MFLFSNKDITISNNILPISRTEKKKVFITSIPQGYVL